MLPKNKKIREGNAKKLRPEKETHWSGPKDLRNGQMRANISGKRNENKNKCLRQQLLAAPKWFIAAFLTVKCACVRFLQR